MVFEAGVGVIFEAGVGVVFAVELSRLAAIRFKGAWTIAFTTLLLDCSLLSGIAGEASVGLVSCALGTR